MFYDSLFGKILRCRILLFVKILVSKHLLNTYTITPTENPQRLSGIHSCPVPGTHQTGVQKGTQKQKQRFDFPIVMWFRYKSKTHILCK